jgi:hypothetical protein
MTRRVCGRQDCDKCKGSGDGEAKMQIKKDENAKRYGRLQLRLHLQTHSKTI